MYSVPTNVRNVLNGPVQTYSLRGVCGGREFSGDHDVIQGSFRLMNQICEATEVALGGVYVGQLNLTFSDSFATTRGSWLNKPITIEIGVLVGGSFTWIPAPGGTYYIKDATWTQNGLEVIAYDAMSKFDKAITLNESSGEVYDFLKFACSTCGVVLGMTKEETRALINGNETIGLYPTDGVQTWRDMLHWLAQATCSFATIARNGKLVLKRFPTTSNTTTSLDTSRRYMGASFSDFETYYTKITVEDIADNVVQSYQLQNDSGLTMALGANPFLQYGLDETVTNMRRAVLEGLSGFEFAPFSVSKLLDPTYDLGDCISFPGGIGRGCVGVVMSYTMDMNSITLQGFGENPALSNVVTDAEKSASAAAGSSKSKSITYLTYINVGDFDLDDGREHDIVNLKFHTSEKTTVTMWMEMVGDASSAGDLMKFHYYLDDELITYSPRANVTEGLSITTLNYYLLNVEPGILHEFKISAELVGFRYNVSAGDLHFLMSGQGLNDGDTYGGTVEVSDSTTMTLGGQLTLTASETVTTALQTPIGPSLSGELVAELFGDLTMSLTENIDVVSKMDVYEMITEDDANILIEDGGLLLTEGDIV